MTTGASIRIYLADGTPEGLRIVEKSNWTGIAVVCSRAQYPKVRGREEFNRPGVYVLTGPADETSPKPLLYVGEGDHIGKRLDMHAKSKDFWTSLVAFTAKDTNLNKAHVKYLESKLIDLATRAKRWKLENAASSSAPMLSEPDQADADAFLENMLLIYPLLGIDAFDLGEPDSKSEGTQLFLKGPDATGVGEDRPDGFVVFAGSLARTRTVDSYSPRTIEIRESLAEDGVLVEEGEHLRFTQDYVFGSPSLAASVLLGRNANGRTEWKDETGRTLKELQEAEILPA